MAVLSASASLARWCFADACASCLCHFLMSHATPSSTLLHHTSGSLALSFHSPPSFSSLMLKAMRSSPRRDTQSLSCPPRYPTPPAIAPNSMRLGRRLSSMRITKPVKHSLRLRTVAWMADVCGLEEELAALELRQQAVASKKAALLEGKARREERAKAAAKRSASVVRLMELEAKSIGIEKEALEMKEKLDVQLGLRLWCQPITLLPDKVMVAFAAPHDWGLKHQLKFVVDESSATSGTCTMVRGPKPEKRGVFSKKGGMTTVGDVGCENSASGRLSRLIFEGEGGIFGGAGGMAVAGLAGVKTVADMRTEVQNAEWFVSRAYSLLQEVHDLEKKYACTVAVVEHDGASAAVEKAAVLCVEVANWRSKQKLVRLRFGLSTSFACLVGAPQVEEGC
ncbi:unnamed protein product [Ectocarpus sp. CCAP 1310/34]|nr:unnamed protein product [Ectocarpus sp. CCAP 1310/34]